MAIELLLVASGVSTASYELIPGQSLDVGRDMVHSLLGIYDFSISKHHIRLTSIAYDESSAAEDEISPLLSLRVLSKNGLALLKHSPRQNVAKHLQPNESRLLTSDDVLMLSASITVHILPCSSGSDSLLTAEAVHGSITIGAYEMSTHTIGKGGFGEVVLATVVSSRRQIACKKILAQQLGSRHKHVKRSLAREVSILKGLHHPNVVRLHDVISTGDSIFIMQELATGGDLMSYINKEGPLCEPIALFMAYQLAMAVQHLHNLNIVHRDIKPENILLSCASVPTRIMLADFGQARVTACDGDDVSRITRMQSFAGSMGWQAPEMRYQAESSPTRTLDYGKAVDIWAMGAVTAAMLTAELPDDTLLDTNLSAVAEQDHTALRTLLPSSPWQGITKQGKLFIRNAMAGDERQRINADQALEHRWFKGKGYAAELQAAYAKIIADWT